MPVYGLAEACLGVSAPPMGTGYKVDRIERSTLESEGRAIPAKPDDPAPLEFVGAGRPMPGVEVRIVDRNELIKTKASASSATGPKGIFNSAALLPPAVTTEIRLLLAN